MSMDLVGPNRIYYWSSTGWGNLLRLALAYGWKWTGACDTCRSEPIPQCWSYMVNEGQWVRAADARAFADALERAMPDLKRGRWRRRRKTTSEQQWFFTKEGQIAVLESIIFLRKGAFRIY
jgi:hypothetical protein